MQSVCSPVGRSILLASENVKCRFSRCAEGNKACLCTAILCLCHWGQYPKTISVKAQNKRMGYNDRRKTNCPDNAERYREAGPKSAADACSNGGLLWPGLLCPRLAYPRSSFKGAPPPAKSIQEERLLLRDIANLTNNGRGSAKLARNALELSQNEYLFGKQP